MVFGDSVGILFKIKADGSEQARREISALRSHVTSEVQNITNSLTASTGAIGRLGAALGPGGIAASALGAASIAAGAGLFQLAQAAAEAGSQVFDLSARTGVSVETLSAFRLVAQQSGTSMDELASGIGRFNRLIGQAASGSDEATAALRRFGIEPQAALQDQEAALARVFERINALPEGIQQSILAQQAFGRSGDRLVGLIREVGGDFDEFKRKAQEAGLILSGEATRAADEFGDTFDELGFSVAQVGRTIGQAVLPEMTVAMRELNVTLRESRELWRSVGEVATTAFIAVRAEVAGLVTFLTTGGNIALAIQSMLGSVHAAVDRLEQIEPGIKARERSSLGDLTGAGSGRGGGADRAAAERGRALELEAQSIQRIYAEQTDALRREYDLQLTSLQSYTQAIIDRENAFFEERREVIGRQSELAESGSDRQRLSDELREAEVARNTNIQRAQDEQRQKEIDALRAQRDAMLRIGETYDNSTIEGLRSLADSRVSTYEAAEQRILDIEIAGLRRRSEAIKQEQESLIARAGDAANINREELAGLVSQFAEIEAQIEALQAAGDRRVAEAQKRDVERARATARLQLEIEQQTRTQALEVGEARIGDMARQGARRLEIINAQEEHETEVATLQHERRVAAIEDAQREALAERVTAEERLRIQAEFNDQFLVEQTRFEDEQARIRREKRVEREREDPTSGRSLFGDVFADSINSGASSLEAFATSAAEIFSNLSEQAGNFATIIGGAFSAIGQAAGAAVKSWALFGTAGTSFRKFAAEVIASVAQMAATKAVFEAAEGLAMLALGYFTGNPKFFASAAGHFLAAAAYGGIGAVAAVAARGIAGDSFKQGAGGRGSGAGAQDGGGGRGTSSAANDTRIIEQNRNEVRPIIVHLHGDIADQRFVDIVVKNFENNGPIRNIIVSGSGG